MHRTVINLKGTGESETDEIKQSLDGQSRSMYFFSLGVRSTHPTSICCCWFFYRCCWRVFLPYSFKRIAGFPSLYAVECSVSLFLPE